MKAFLTNKYHNVLVYDFLYRIGFCIHNVLNNFYSKKYLKVDPIKNYQDFVDVVEEIKKKRFVLGKRFLGCECLYYGHYDMLVEYSHYKPKYRTIGMGIVHGVDFSEAPLSLGRMYNTFMFFSQGNKSKVKNTERFSLQLDIGPFIHYANKIYSEDEEKVLKKKYGRTVLIYPTHTYEKSEIDGRELDRYREMIRHYSEVFDTILFCVYWHDVLDDTFQEISSIPKVKLVSCGLRSDKKFLSRTKTLISLADLIVGTHVGTYLGYAMYMKKEIEYYELEESIQEYGVMTDDEVLTEIKNKDLIKKVLLEKSDTTDIYNDFWGGETKLCTEEEIAAAFELRDEVISSSMGFVIRFNRIIQTLKEKYKNSTDPRSQFKYKYLEEINGKLF